MDSPAAKNSFIWLASAAAFALTFPFQPTLTLQGQEVRFAASDILALALLPLALISLRDIKDLFRERWMRVLAGLVLAATIVMTISLFIGASAMGAASNWALVKYLGWYALLLYALLGYLLWQHAKRRGFWIFLWTFAVFQAAMVMVFSFGQFAGVVWLSATADRLSGFMANPNAFALSVICSLSLLLYLREFSPYDPGKYGYELLLGILGAGVLFTTSIAAMIALVLVLVISAVLQSSYLSSIRILLCAVAIYLAPGFLDRQLQLTGLKSNPGTDLAMVNKLTKPDPNNLLVRVDSAKMALELWREKPLLGTGLGVFIAREWKHVPSSGDKFQIHSTPLWLLTELGLVGLSIFVFMAALISWMLLQAYLASRTIEPFVAAMFAGGLTILAAWACMSLVHELLYQRIPWFFLGICLGLVLSHQAKEPQLQSRRDS